jgi:hypothetical protein
MISKASLKLRIMSDLTVKKGNVHASLNWKDNVVKSHEKEMIDILKEACGLSE